MAGLISSSGAAACVRGLAGVAYTFAVRNVSVIGGACDLSPWRPVDVHAGVRAAAAGQGFTLPAGMKVAAFKVIGLGAPPSATLTGPGGAHFSVSPTHGYSSAAGLWLPEPA